MDKEHDFSWPEQLAIFKKGKEIFEIVDQICELIADDNIILQHTKGKMYGDAALLSVKVARAESGRSYDLKMENAAIIRKAARHWPF